MKLLYFAWLRTKIGMAEERVPLPAGVTDVAGLIEWLRGRGAGYADALANLDVVKVAVNQEYVPFSHPVTAGDEVALFPPVTGG
ncbi:molybdopterin converting factor subunit 1 [Niveispirillum lacus]|uniref:Molybdopterin synthase sulfur carrier subunit n=1 Tax=Niveispirillum lacus TaxID=1981099 RepID=A0A255YYS9_9PROT|nr:molybdopterin converting factor subunit 1 [Niveispirillum lacus]OYQ33834.1 molybdopterin converting factor subunit 1 [Niveispirillum lacus]